jgi:hypothetical protein
LNASTIAHSYIIERQIFSFATEGERGGGKINNPVPRVLELKSQSTTVTDEPVKIARAVSGNDKAYPPYHKH